MGSELSTHFVDTRKDGSTCRTTASQYTAAAGVSIHGGRAAPRIPVTIAAVGKFSSLENALDLLQGSRIRVES